MRKGFTLTEVLAGLFILALVVAMTLPSINRALFIESKTQLHGEKVLYLRNCVERIKSNAANGFSYETGIEENENFTYTIHQEEIDGYERLEKVKVEVMDHENIPLSLEIVIRKR